MYYVDHNTRTTTWLRPDVSLLAAHSQWQQTNENRSQTDFNQRFLYPQQQQQMMEHNTTDDDKYGPLPEGWEKRVDKTGRVRRVTGEVSVGRENRVCAVGEVSVGREGRVCVVGE